MTELEIIRWLLTLALGGLIWFMKRTLNSAEDNIKALQQGQQDIKEKYLHKDDFREFKQELRGMFEEIKTDIKQLRKHGE